MFSFFGGKDLYLPSRTKPFHLRAVPYCPQILRGSIISRLETSYTGVSFTGKASWLLHHLLSCEGVLPTPTPPHHPQTPII